MAVFVVVPGHETGDPALRVLLAGETRCRPVRPVLAGPEQGFGERVIVADPRPAVGGDDAGAGEAALRPDRLAHELGGQLGTFAFVDLPADDLAAVDIEDQVEIEEPALD